MSQEDVDIVRRVYEAAARGDSAAVYSLYHADVEWDFTRHPAGDMMSGKRHHGHQGLRAWFREWRDGWEAVVDELLDVIDAGDHVVSVVSSRGRGRGSGMQVELQHAALWTVRQAKVVRVVWFGTAEEALREAGLRE